MNDIVTPAPAWLRIAAAIGLLWNLIGIYFYLVSVGALPPPADAPAEAAAPTWVTAAFAVAVFGGALGSLGLMLLKRWSRLLLLLSFLGVLATDLWAYALRESGPGDDIILSLAVNVIGLALVVLAYAADKRGWLR